ncbi:uncharacterized protein C8A04DRAFT_14110 [Dichotomopilus funicola]|uniref:Uncharacterized protein n=1 Tax=Dichotomopilus funicola TaxID=1934379 RepID=A0AAN6UZ18_9PEZI|nr:hypothetical protein C8A04DRAFT_14110 [Dichotomopilus funicola]
MGSSSSSSPVIRFGIELELLLASTANKHNSWDSLARDLSEKLIAAGVPNHVGDDHTYAEWSIVHEITVKDHNPYHYGVELVSPIYTTSEISTFHNTLVTIFDLLNSCPNDISLIPTDRASSHIHLSRDPPLSAEEAARLAKATLYYELALDSLILRELGSGRTTYWAQSNRAPGANPVLHELETCCAMNRIDMAMGRGDGGVVGVGVVVIDTAGAGPTSGAQPTCGIYPGGSEDLVRLAKVVMAVNMVSRDSRMALCCGHLGAHFVRGKTYKWDFSGLLSVAAKQALASTAESPGIPNTVEFRQPPGSKSAEDALKWVVLAVAFFAGAVKPEVEGSTKALDIVLKLGEEEVGWEHLGGLKLFEGNEAL